MYAGRRSLYAGEAVLESDQYFDRSVTSNLAMLARLAADASRIASEADQAVWTWNRRRGTPGQSQARSC
jgi:hypothetical protein